MIRESVHKIWHLLPNDFTYKIDIFRRSYVWKKQSTIFIHIPKAAGVSICKAIYGKPLGHFYAKDILHVCPDLFNQVFTFSVVRNPIDRLYSAYRFSKNGGTKDMRMHKSKYYINNHEFITFDSFVMHWLANRNLSELDHVFRPQHLYLFDEKDNLLVDKFYKLENIHHHYEDIAINIGKPFFMGSHNVSIKEEFSITNSLKDKIYELYEKDFELLGYSR